jgi:phosphatidylserine decarboxylase
MVRDGYIYGLSLIAVAAVVVWLAGGWWWALGPLLLAAFFLWFFRDPERLIPAGSGLIVSPGDGLVTETAAISTPEGPRRRISIFLSVFDVHVNRSPISGVLTRVHYQKGQYLNAMNPASAERNEQNIVTVRGEGFEVTFKQIAGLLARRIVFNHAEGDQVERGQRVGLIKFGSRVDVVIPAAAVLQVKVGDRVRGGASVLAAMPGAAVVKPEARVALAGKMAPELPGGDRL